MEYKYKTKKGMTKKIKEMSRTTFKNSLAPAKNISYKLRDNLNLLGIVEEEHFLFVLNRI